MESPWSRWRIASWLVVFLVSLGLMMYWEDMDRSSTQQKAQAKGPTMVDLLEEFGYVAEEHTLITSDGYILTLTRVHNPLIKQRPKNKIPLLFVPGESCTAGVYLLNAKGSQPRDFTHIDAGNLTVPELIKRFEGEPTAKSLVLLASNFGRDVWLGNRRGYPKSQGHIDPKKNAYHKKTDKVGETDQVMTECCLSGDIHAEEDCDPVESLRLIMTEYQKSVNRDYWNFTLDDEALVDLGDSINYILEETGHSKLDLVGHSSGGALIPMVLIGRPEIQDKVSNIVLHAPTLYQAKYTRIPLDAAEPALTDYIGPFSIRLETTRQVVCLTKRACLLKYKGLNDENGKPLAERCLSPLATTMNQLGYVVGNLHTTQLMQNLGKRMRYFDYGDPEKNMLKYGQPEPPVYDVGKIKKQRVSIYYGSHDKKISPEMGRMLIEDFSVPVEVHYFDDPAMRIDHGSTLVHKDIDKLLIIPSLKQIESSGSLIR